MGIVTRGFKWGTLLAGLCLSYVATAEPTEVAYRDFTLKLRAKSSFRVPMPSNGDMSFVYELKLGSPIFAKPVTFDFPLDPDTGKFYRHFWDKVFVQDSSYLLVGNEQVPLTCIFVTGQDNRFSGKNTPLIPDYVFKVYLVANDYSCTGPINPAWPNDGGKRETWDTYVYFEVRDPTVMLPTDIKIRYRSIEFPAVLIDDGRK